MLFFAWLYCKAPINLASVRRSDWRWGIRRKKKYGEVENFALVQARHSSQGYLILCDEYERSLKIVSWIRTESGFFFSMRKFSIASVLHSFNHTCRLLSSILHYTECSSAVFSRRFSSAVSLVFRWVGYIWIFFVVEILWIWLKAFLERSFWFRW